MAVRSLPLLQLTARTAPTSAAARRTCAQRRTHTAHAQVHRVATCKL